MYGKSLNLKLASLAYIKDNYRLIKLLLSRNSTFYPILKTTRNHTINSLFNIDIATAVSRQESSDSGMNNY